MTVEFRVLPPTLVEAKEALLRAEDRASRVVLTRNIAMGVSALTFRGAVQGFVEQARRPDGIRDAKRYFRPYIESLPSVLRDDGVEVFADAAIDAVASSQDVIDDILQQQEFESRRQGGGKSYEQTKHDVVLWHFTRRRRVPGRESALDVRYWVVTIDFRFLGFNDFKLRNRREPPICIHPASLLQLLRFWVPRSEDVDRALVGALRLPLLFKPFDASTERAVLRILETLARFENSDKLSAEAVQDIVQSRQLITRIGGTDSVEEQTALVRDELVMMESTLRERLAKTEAAMADAKGEADTWRTEALRLQEQIAALEGTIAEKSSADHEGQDETSRKLREAQSNVGTERRRGARLYAVLSSVIAALVGGIAFLLFNSVLHQGALRAGIAAGAVALLSVMELAFHARYGANDQVRAFRGLARLRARMAAVTWAVLIGVAGNVVHSLVQPYLPPWLGGPGIP